MRRCWWSAPATRPSARQVTADRTIGDKWLVTAGLAAGDKVITEGLGRVKPGPGGAAGAGRHRRSALGGGERRRGGGAGQAAGR